MKARKAFLLRLDPGLHAALERWSANEMRSVNGQIEYLLRDAVLKHDRNALLDDDRTPPEVAEVGEVGNEAKKSDDPRP